MSTIAHVPVLADAAIARPDQHAQRLARDGALIAAGIAVVAALARVEIPMWPVPVTGQTLGVLLVGATLGARRGALALTGYAGLGLAGAPVFAGGAGGVAMLTAPSFGFVLGFIPAAALIGYLSERRWDRRPALAVAGFGLASLIPFLIGVPYMGAVLAALGLPHDASTLLSLGVTPFLIGGAVKWAIAAAVLPLAWRALGRR